MTENERDNTGDVKKGANNYAKYMGLAIQMMVIIGGTTFIGYKIDKANAHNVQWVTAVFALAGVFISLYLVIRSVKS